MLNSEKLFSYGSDKEPGLEEDLFNELPRGLQEWVKLTYQSGLTREEALAKWRQDYRRTRPDFDRAAVMVEGVLVGFYIGRKAVHEDWKRRRGWTEAKTVQNFWVKEDR